MSRWHACMLTKKPEHFPIHMEVSTGVKRTKIHLQKLEWNIYHDSYFSFEFKCTIVMHGNKAQIAIHMEAKLATEGKTKSKLWISNYGSYMRYWGHLYTPLTKWWCKNVDSETSCLDNSRCLIHNWCISWLDVMARSHNH